MQLLPPPDYSSARSLYGECSRRFPLISAVLNGSQQGQVFVGGKEQAGTVFTVTRFGFAHLYAQQPAAAADEWLLNSFLEGGTLTCSYILWYDAPEPWYDRLRIVSDNVRKRTRIRYTPLGKLQFAAPAEQLSGDLRIEPLNRDLLPAVEKIGVRIEGRFWDTFDDFAQEGLGVCLMCGNEVVSVCYSACVADGLVEIDVATRENVRAKGYASSAAAYFIRLCHERGLMPTWDCFDYNESSRRLAAKLGFAESYRYSFLSFNVPVPRPGVVGQ